MKVVINKSGTFALAPAAMKRAIAEKAAIVTVYDEHFYYGGKPRELDMFTDVGDGFEEGYGERVYWKDGKIYTLDATNAAARCDSVLVRIVEEMGIAVNGSSAQLHVVEVPDDVDWLIDESDDGREIIEEKHRTWG